MTFEKIYSTHYDKVYSWINFKIGDKEKAEELAQDVMLKVHKNLSEYNNEKSALTTWIMNITKNTIIDHYRTNKTGVIVSMGEFEDEDGKELVVHTDYSNPETYMENNELGSAIQSAINSLPQTYQTIADMFLLKERSHEEIASDLSIPIGTVKGTISRAKDLLRKRLLKFS